MTPWQKVLLTFVSVWIVGDIIGAPHFDNLVFSLAMGLGMAVYENVHKSLWGKIKGLAHR